MDAPFLNCDGATAATRDAASLAQRRGGIGGRVRKFSPFGAVDPLQSLTGVWSGTFRSAAATQGAPVSYTLVEGANGAITGTYVFQSGNTEPGTMTASLSGRTALNWTMTNTGDCPGSWTGQGTVDATGTQITSTFTGSDCTTGGATISGEANITRRTVAQQVTITTTSLPGGTVTQQYFAQLAATGGTGTYTWSVGSGTLPTGLTLNNATGVISGTPSFAGTGTVTIVAQSGGVATSRQFTITINALGNVELVLTLQGTGTGTVTSTPGAISCQRTGTGQTGTCAGSFGVGSTVSLAVTPTGGSTFGGWGGACSGTAPSCQVTMSAARNVTATFTGVAPVTVTTSTLPGATTGLAYTATLQASGGTGAYTWSITAGALPVGLTLNPSSGVISGVPTVAGQTTFTVRATSGAQSGERSLGILVSQGGGGNVRLTVTPRGFGIGGQITSNPTAIACQLSFGQVLGTCAADFPSGTSVALSFTPNAGTNGVLAGWSGGGCTGNGPCTVTLTTATTVEASMALPLVITGALPRGALGAAYTGTLTATGGTDAKTWSLVSGTLPPGLNLQASGAITGTPTAEGTFGFTTRVTSLALSAEQAVSITVGAVIELRTRLASGAIYTAQDNGLQFVVNPNTGGPYTWSIVTGTLPPGLTLSASTGILAGQPTTAGSYPVTVRALSATQDIQTALTIVVQQNPCPAGQVYDGRLCLF